VACYASFLLLGYVPVNCHGKASPEDDSVCLFIRSNEIHTDFVLPVSDDSSGINWSEMFAPQRFRGDVSQCRYVAIGWGNRGFFVETPTWSDLKLTTALGAIVPSESVLHVEYLYDAVPGEYFHELRLSRDQYRELAAFIRETVGRVDENGQAALATESSYSHQDRFFLAKGSYHAFNNCNQWTGRGLQRAGVRTGIWTPLKSQVSCWLK
jgi:uncharacterized protein (TIGR02117 family)